MERDAGLTVVEKKEKKPFWKLWTKDSDESAAVPAVTATQDTAEKPLGEGRQARKEARTAEAGAETKKPADTAGAVPVPEENPAVEVVEQTPKKPFWKFWQK